MMTDDEARQNMTAHEKEITVAEKSNEDTKYVLVPREPTQAMSDAAASTPGQMSYADVYRAMIAAAPALPNSDEVAGMVKRLRADIAVLEKALLDIADADSTNGTFDAIYRNKTLIEAARTRKGDHRG